MSATALLKNAPSADYPNCTHDCFDVRDILDLGVVKGYCKLERFPRDTIYWNSITTKVP